MFTNNPVLKVMDEVVNECVPERAVVHVTDTPVLECVEVLNTDGTSNQTSDLCSFLTCPLP